MYARDYTVDYQVGDVVMWPDRTESRIGAIDHDDDMLMRACDGEWISAHDVERAACDRAEGVAA